MTKYDEIFVKSVVKGDEKLKKEHVSDAKTATVLHNQVGQEVRATIKRVGGTLPENQPTPEKSIDEITKEQLKKLKSHQRDRKKQMVKNVGKKEKLELCQE